MKKLNVLKKNQQLGKYKLLRHLGNGAYCAVWKAFDTIESAHVALKITRSLSDDSERKAILKEISLLTRLDHPNIVRIKNADLIDKWFVIATELGLNNLEELRLPLPASKAISAIIQILNALEYAHNLKIVHRDVKPENVILFPGDVVKLADFGIAKSMDATKTMSDVGTVEFRAPEQAYGYPGKASDLFSTGLLLHYLLSGQIPAWPFKWPYPGVLKYRWKFTRSVNAVIQKATSIDISKRYRSVSQFRSDLVTAAKKMGINIHPSKAHKRTKKTAAGKHWTEIRFIQFRKRYRHILELHHICCKCGGPVANTMAICPWCGVRYTPDEVKPFTEFCSKCKRGVKNEWKYCPWCYRPKFKNFSSTLNPNKKYIRKCQKCKGHLMLFMRYCPWCHSKARPWIVKELIGRCPHCRWSVASDEWSYCPWCRKNLEV